MSLSVECRQTNDSKAVCHGTLGAGRGGLGIVPRRQESSQICSKTRSSMKHSGSFVFVIGINIVRSHSQRSLSKYMFIQLVESNYEGIIKTEGSAKFNTRYGPHTLNCWKPLVYSSCLLRFIESWASTAWRVISQPEAENTKTPEKSFTYATL